MNQSSEQRRSNGRRYVPRFAGAIFSSDSPVEREGSEYRRLLSTEAWKAPPSSSIQITH